MHYAQSPTIFGRSPYPMASQFRPVASQLMLPMLPVQFLQSKGNPNAFYSFGDTAGEVLWQLPRHLQEKIQEKRREWSWQASSVLAEVRELAMSFMQLQPFLQPQHLLGCGAIDDDLSVLTVPASQRRNRVKVSLEHIKLLRALLKQRS